jgi:deazaflavin-dependent oxidoreductase (nitroreductase family)
VTGWRRRILRFPITLYRWRLDGLISRRILLLRTLGRRSGTPRVTPLEYLYDGATDTYFLMAGWGGHTDWVRNLRAEPRVRVRVGRRELARQARVLGPAEGGVVLQRWIGRAPSLVRVLERDTGLHYDGTLASAADLVSHYAVVALPPD